MKRKYSDAELLNAEGMYRSAESHANRFNLVCLAVLGGLSVLCELLNNIGVFEVDKALMHICSASALGVFLLPGLVWYINDRVMGREPSLTEWRGLKYLIVVTAYVGIALYCVALTYHTIFLLTLPPIFAAQYSNQKYLLRLTLFCGILVVPIAVYLGYFYGFVDRNQVFDLVVRNGDIVSMERFPKDIPARMVQLLLHYVLPRLLGVIAVIMLVSGIARRNGNMLSRQAVLAEQVRREMRTRDEMQTRVIEDLSATIETRDLGSRQHIEHTKKYVAALLRLMRRDPVFCDRITEEYIEEVESAAPLHDVGMVFVSDAILLKPGKLTPMEFDVVKTHCQKGGEMIRNIFSSMEDTPRIQIAEEIALNHHERWDGSGYPRGLKGEEIPLPARVMAIADVYDTLISERVYKKPMDPADALQIVYAESGSHFDPEIIRILKENDGAAFRLV